MKLITPNKKEKMNLVHTPPVNQTEYNRKADGKIDLDSYVGLNATITENGLTVATKIVGARTRYGHLDLNVTPQAGEGTRWVEYKNLSISNPSPASPVAELAGLVAHAITPTEKEEVVAW
jgi:hypothetical protein